MLMSSMAIIWSGLLFMLLSSAQRKYMTPLLVNGVAKMIVTGPLLMVVPSVKLGRQRPFAVGTPPTRAALPATPTSLQLLAILVAVVQ